MTGFWDRFGRFVSSRRSWIVLVVALMAIGAVTAIGTSSESTGSPQGLPSSAEAARAAEVLTTFPDANLAPVVAVFSRQDNGALTASDLQQAAAAYQRMLRVDRGVTDPAPTGQPPVIGSEDGKAAISTVYLSAELSGFDLTDTVASVRDAGRDGLDSAVTLQVTGGPAFGADIANAFKGADFRLLGFTALVVAVLLLVTYRSPILWIVPLLVVGLADRTAAIVAAWVAGAAGISLDGSTTGITSVLVFGAGTNYALLLVSRYREELRRTPDHRAALAVSVRHAGPAIVASNITVVLAVSSLLLAITPSNQALGLSSATGLLVALIFVLLMLPPALALTGRRLFWPFIPTRESRRPLHDSRWYTVADWVRLRPVVTLLITLPILVVGVCGIVGVPIGLSQAEQFRVQAESADGLKTLETHFSSGLSSPTTVVARTDRAPEVLTAITATDGVGTAAPSGTSEAGWTRFRVILDADPSSDEAFSIIDALRSSVHAVDGAQALVGGADAQALDAERATTRDQVVVIPIILGVVFVVLLILLRALLAPVMLIGATILSAFAATGAGAWMSIHALGFPALASSVPLFAFLFLVALGIDYTIFLVTRAREETPEHGAREGVVRAVALTGGVITSAGIVLAAVFGVLGVLPLITLTQLGIVVGVGILIDTFVVRTLVIPALFGIVGRRAWWPSDLSRGKD